MPGSLAGLGDTDGDGYGDVLIGSYESTITGTTTGAVYLMFGGEGL